MGNYQRHYTAKRAKHICQELMKGRTLTRISEEDEDIPTLVAIYSWMNPNHPQYHPEFVEAYNLARKIQAEVLADEIKDISDNDTNDNQVKLGRDKLRIDNRKWMAAKMSPKKFGDKVELTGADGDPLIPKEVKIVINLVPCKKENDEPGTSD